MKTKPVIIISGATASGKTSCSLKVATFLKQQQPRDVEIVNFDSLLFYKELNIGNAKPTIQELSLIPHHMINICSAKHPINACDYIERAKPLIDKLHRESKIVILVGGSGFYLRALVKGMYAGVATPAEIKMQVAELYRLHGIGPLREILKSSDPESLHQLHENDHYRIRRAVEFFIATGGKISQQKLKQDQLDPYNLLRDRHTDWQLFHCYLDIEKPQHLQIIEQRTDKMLAQGLVEEVQNLLRQGFDGSEKPINSIGYKETLNYLKGAYTSRQVLAERIVISTRQLAKSQRTFFKKITPQQQFNPLMDEKIILQNILAFLEE